MAKRSNGAEGWSATTGKQVAERSLVDMSLAPEVPTSPAAQDPRPVDRANVDEPPSRCSHLDISWNPAPDLNGMYRLAAPKAMECTVLRVPCMSWSGYWRSTVGGLGPPPSSCSLAASARVPRRGHSLASVAFGDTQVLVQSVARRIARLNARTG